MAEVVRGGRKRQKPVETQHWTGAVDFQAECRLAMKQSTCVREAAYLLEEQKVPRGAAIDVPVLHRLRLVRAEELYESPAAPVLPLLRKR